MKNDIIKHAQEYAQAHGLIPDQSTIIIGLSGGPDSVFLLYFLHALQKEKNLTLIAAHLDHQWRKESADEVLFCKELCKELDIPCISATLAEVKKSAGDALAYNGSQESYARSVRRYFFQKIAREKQATAIALAHHADDQQETFFIRIMRGASLTGLCSMYPKNGLYIRPLLTLHKQDILDYLHAARISYVTDTSNMSDLYLRNRIRNHLIPALHTCDARFDASFNKTLGQLQETERFLQNLALSTAEKIRVTINTENFAFNFEQCMQLDPVLQQRLFMIMFAHNKMPYTPSQKFFQEIMRFLAQPGSGAHAIHAHWQMVKKRSLNIMYIEKIKNVV